MLRLLMALLRNSLIEIRSRHGEIHDWISAEVNHCVASLEVHHTWATHLSQLSNRRLDSFVERLDQKINEGSDLTGESSAGRVNSVEV